VKIDPQAISPDADILVGVPCYRDGAMVARCLDSLPARDVQLLIVDNGSDPDVKPVLEGRGVVLRNEVNQYVNPAWNQMMQWFLENRRFDLLVLANSDLVLEAGWAEALRDFRVLSQTQLIYGTIEHGQQPSMGAFFAMTRPVVEAVWPIPDDLLIYGGDDFIFEMSKRLGFAVGTASQVSMTHEVSGTIRKSPEVWEIGARDTQRWHRHVLPNIVPARVREVKARG